MCCILILPIVLFCLKTKTKKLTNWFHDCLPNGSQLPLCTMTQGPRKNKGTAKGTCSTRHGNQLASRPHVSETAITRAEQHVQGLRKAQLLKITDASDFFDGTNTGFPHTQAFWVCSADDIHCKGVMTPALSAASARPSDPCPPPSFTHRLHLA